VKIACGFYITTQSMVRGSFLVVALFVSLQVAIWIVNKFRVDTLYNAITEAHNGVAAQFQGQLNQSQSKQSKTKQNKTKVILVF